MDEPSNAPPTSFLTTDDKDPPSTDCQLVSHKRSHQPTNPQHSIANNAKDAGLLAMRVTLRSAPLETRQIPEQKYSDLHALEDLLPRPISGLILLLDRCLASPALVRL
jgi:hypothetical protein